MISSLVVSTGTQSACMPVGFQPQGSSMYFSTCLLSGSAGDLHK